VGDSLGDAANSVGDSVGNAAHRVGDSVKDAVDRVGGRVGDAADRVRPRIEDAADDVADRVGDTADDLADSLSTGVTVTVREFRKISWQSVGDTVGDAADRAGESIGDAADDVTDSVSTGTTVIVREVTKIRGELVRGNREAGDQHRLPTGPRKFSSAAVAAIEPSAGSAIAGCATDDGKQQSTEISCETRDRQIAYASPGATTIDGRSPGASPKSDSPAAALDGQPPPSTSRLPSDRGLHDEIYRLQQVEAWRYSDRDMPVLVVQGRVSNMSNGQRSVPPLLAIVRNDQGKELMRWTFHAEAETLGPGASTGFRSEMFDPQSESAKVTIVLAPEQQRTQ
jgi:hypothetical protein